MSEPTNVSPWRAATSNSGDLSRDVESVAAALASPELIGVLLYLVPSATALEPLARRIQSSFSCPVVGCTGAALLGAGGYHKSGISALGFYGPNLSFQPHLLSSLKQGLEAARNLGQRIKGEQAALPSDAGQLCLLLVDALSAREELLVSTLHASLGGIALGGGSAADCLRFERTPVLFDGEFHDDAAVVLGLSGRFRAATMVAHHFAPLEPPMVVTKADTAHRRLQMLDGEPAAQRLARVLGVGVETLASSEFFAHPLVGRIGADQYLRSIKFARPDGTLELYGTVVEGQVFRLGQSTSPFISLEQQLSALKQALGDREPELLLGFDCVLRFIEFSNTGLLDEVGARLSRASCVGFSTYGEQTHGLHVNHTLTGVGLVAI